MAGFQVMPPLTSEERAELEESIKLNGVQVPILVAADGTIVDGHHRDEIARKHNLHCPRTVSDKSESELRGLAFSLNLHRRHLTREQRRQIVAESIKADPQMSDREHGRRAGVSKNTAAAVREELEAGGQVDHLDYRENPQGRPQPATKPRRETTFTDESDNEVGGIVDGRDPDEPLDQDWIDAAYDADDVPSGQQLGAPADPPREVKRPRKPITEQARVAGWELIKAVERIQRIANDDRFEPQKEKVTPHLRGHLINTISACQDVLDRLSQEDIQ